MKRTQMWEIKQQAENSLDLYIYGDVEGDSYDWWKDEVIRSETAMAVQFLKGPRFIIS